MRLWSIHPKYLDSKGIVALWREGLLAKAVLEGKTKGYTNHPQLQRFKKHKSPLNAINAYLFEVLVEANERGYNFDKTKVVETKLSEKIIVTRGQIEFEQKHLLKKLNIRDKVKHSSIKKEMKILPHRIFEIVEGEIEPWEKAQFEPKYKED